VTPPIRRQLIVPGGAELAFRVFTDEIGTWWPVGTGHSVFGAGSTVVVRDVPSWRPGPMGRGRLGHDSSTGSRRTGSG
jgi:hypothetical protein